LVLRALLAIAATLTAISVVVELLTGPVGAPAGSEFYDASLLLNSAAEHSVANFYSATLLAACALIAASIAEARRSRAEPYALHWMGLAILLGYMAVDEGAAVHEASITPVRNALDAHGPLFFAWVVPGAVAALALALAYFGFCRDLPRRIRAPFIAAMAALFGAALGLEMVEGVLFDSYDDTGLLFGIAITAEELIEMCALAVLAYALLVELAASVGTLRLEPITHAAPIPRGGTPRPGIISPAISPIAGGKPAPDANRQSDGPT
jgi:hypothetical protein